MAHPLAATNEEIEVLENADDAGLSELLGQADVHQQVADSLQDNPLAADAQTTADHLLAQAAAAQLRQRERRAARAAWWAVALARDQATSSLDRLSAFGQLLISPGYNQLAALPFPAHSEIHWQDTVAVTMPATKQVKHLNLLWPLMHGLMPLQLPLTALAGSLKQLNQQLPVALRQSSPPSDPTQPADSPALPDEQSRMLERLTKLAGEAGKAAQVLRQLLEQYRAADHAPVFRRGYERDPLAFGVRRVPYDLHPYLGPQAPPPVPGSSLPVQPLLGAFRTVVFTTATLYVKGTTEYFRRELNLPVPFASELHLRSAFTYNGNADSDDKHERVLGSVAAYLPRYNSAMTPTAREGWANTQLRALLPLLLALDGRTLVLFTSKEDMGRAEQFLRLPLARHDIELLVQQDGASPWQIRRFRRTEQSVLLGVDRLWTGVDFPSRTLSQVVVWRLPMPSFSDVLVSHRKRHEPANVFWQAFYYPATRLKLRQGFGRLVRREGDRGAFTVLDARAADPFYEHLLNELDLETFADHIDGHAHQRELVEEVLPLLRLKEDFTRRGWTLDRLAAVAADPFHWPWS